MRKVVKFKVGYCPCCKKNTVFMALDYWLRENYKCVRCWCIPRQRAIMAVLDARVAGWESMRIHESSPCGPTFERMKKVCPNYSYSYFYPDKAEGQFLDERGMVTNQNLQ